MTINATITGLKFFFDITLGQPDLKAKMQHVNVPRKLPVILSPEEVGRLIAAAPNLKHQAAMSVAYGAGLRVSEVVSLKVTDIDSQRMPLRVEQGTHSCGAKRPPWRSPRFSPSRLLRHLPSGGGNPRSCGARGQVSHRP